MKQTTSKTQRHTSQGRDQDRQFVTTSWDVAILMKQRYGADALILFAVLKITHGESGTPFAISASTMAKARVLEGWNAYRYRRTRALLQDLGFLVLARRGGWQPREPNLYLFPDEPPPPDSGAAPSPRPAQDRAA